MYKHKFAAATASTLVLSVSAAFAIPISTSDGVINSIAGTASWGEVAAYVSGGNGLTGTGTTWPADVGDGIGSVVQEASNIDRYWLQYISSGAGGPGAGSIFYSLTGATSDVLAVPGIDHDPLPYEALEFIVWGWTGATWEEGRITAIYDQGADAAWAFDDFASVWSFSGAYTDFAVSGGTHYTGPDDDGCPGLTCTEGEFDGLAAWRRVPEPGTILLLSAGGIGLLATRRRTA